MTLIDRCSDVDWQVQLTLTDRFSDIDWQVRWRWELSTNQTSQRHAITSSKVSRPNLVLPPSNDRPALVTIAALDSSNSLHCPCSLIHDMCATISSLFTLLPGSPASPPGSRRKSIVALFRHSYHSVIIYTLQVRTKQGGCSRKVNTVLYICLKTTLNVAHYNFDTHQRILIIFGRDVADTVCY